MYTVHVCVQNVGVYTCERLAVTLSIEWSSYQNNFPHKDRYYDVGGYGQALENMTQCTVLGASTCIMLVNYCQRLSNNALYTV